MFEKLNSKYVKTDSAYFHQKGLKDLRETIRLEQALYMLQSKEVMGVGFIEATFDSEPKRTPMEFGWFDLRDDDINLAIKENHVSVELWFNGSYGTNDSHLGVRTVSVQDGNIVRSVEQVKLKLNISHEQLDYVIKDGTRYHIEKK